jgi:hypothetical protein
MPPSPQNIVEELLSQHCTAEVKHSGIWLRVHESAMSALPASGWKLHVSATPCSYPEILTRLVHCPALQGTPFKCIASLELLEDLNDGRFGLPQAGKAITLYPSSESHAAAIASELAISLQGCAGPAILTDLPISDKAPVYYRYGPFDGRSSIDSLARKHRLLRLPDGNDIIDTPHDARLPSPTVLPHSAPEDHLDFLRDDYLIVTILHLSARGGVFIALPKNGPERHPVIIKTARRHAQADIHGRDAQWALQREHETLEALRGNCGAPPAGRFVLHPQARAAALIRPYLAGETLIERWQAPAARSAHESAALAGLLHALHTALHQLHEAGYLLRDLSPANVLCAAEAIHFIDLELAQRENDPAPPYRRGTPGFYDATHDRHAAPTWRDDAYSLLSLAHWLHSGVHPQWSRVTTRTGLTAIADVPAHPQFQAAWRHAAQAEDAETFFTASASLSNLAALPAPAPTSWQWNSDAALTELRGQVEASLQFPRHTAESDSVNLFSGLSGDLLTLAEAAQKPEWRFDTHALSDCLTEAAKPLAHIPGLYFGTPGIALAQLHLGHADAAREMLLSTHWLDSAIPDLCHGLAGYLAALLHAHAHTGEAAYLAHASEAGERLLHLAQWNDMADGSHCAWSWPEGSYTGLSGIQQYGFAHGVAGILAALAQLHEAAPTARLADAIVAGARFLAAGARALPGDIPGRWWPVSAQDESCWNAWSHGTPGVLKGLCAARRALPDAVAESLLLDALDGIRSANNAGYCLCHGIASRLDAYIDAACTLADRQPGWLTAEALTDATALAALDLWAIEARVRRDAGDDGYGLLKGAAGVVRTLLRFDRAFHGGAFLLAGGHTALDGQVLTAQRLERGAVGRGCLHRHLLL